MKILQSSLLLIAIFSALACMQTEPRARVELVPPSIDQEAASIWMAINTYEFLEEYGYDVKLPEDSIITVLIEKSRNGTFGNDDYSTIYNLLEAKYFDPQDYQVAISTVEENLNLINEMVADIERTSQDWDWEFKMFESYPIQFTLYGTGGGYDPESGTVTLMTSKEGDFIQNENPSYTIIHEITHMGLEASIVQKYSLEHGFKERLVDTFVMLMFLDKLPEYQMQNMGDPRLDDLLKTRSDLSDLETVVIELTEE